MWLNINFGWYYVDKVSGVVYFNWDVSDLRKWIVNRLCFVIVVVFGCEIKKICVFFDEMWYVFFMLEVMLKNKLISDLFSYFVCCLMYILWSFRVMIKFVFDGLERLLVIDLEI